MVGFLAQDVILYVNGKLVSFRDLHKSPYLCGLLASYYLKAIWWCIGYNVSSMVIYSVGTKYLEQLALNNSNIGQQEANLSLGIIFIHSSWLIKEIDASKNFTRILEKIAPKIGGPVLSLKGISILWRFSPYRPRRYMKPMRSRISNGEVLPR